MRKLQSILLGCFVGFGGYGCATRPAVVDSSPSTPFEELTIRTSLGAVRGYLYKPQDAAVRLVVALQSSPCRGGTDRDDDPVLDTDGAVWDRFKYDSLFFQFERPGGMSDEHSVVVACERADRTAEDWQRVVVDTMRAVRKREHLEGVPTTYLGVGAGAALALRTALNDPESKSIVLMSATVGSSLNDAISQPIAPSRARQRPSILFIHGGSDERTSVDQIARIADSLSAQQIPTELIVFDEVGADFGSNSTQTNCFDLVASKVAEHVRFDQRGQRRVRVACKLSVPATGGPVVQRMERL